MKKVLFYTLVPLLWLSANLLPLLFFYVFWPRTSVPEPLLLDARNPMVANAVVALLFPLQHSLWTQRAVKPRMRALFTDYFERPMYILSTGVFLVATALLWQPMGPALWEPGPVIWLLRMVYVFAILGQIVSVQVLGESFMNGIAHVRKFMQQNPPPQIEFREAFLYKYVRHPIAMCQVIMVWSFGTLRPDLLLLACIWTAWIVIAAALEERRLLDEIGDEYRAYQQRAGFLWPKFGGPDSPTSA